MDNLSDFLKQFNIPNSVFESTGLDWNMLLEIRADYEGFIPELTPPANYLIEAFHSVKSIHSVRFRLKSPSHLIEKIIRKKVEEPERIIDLTNYRNEITDLIGLRALHLFKEDWLSIHHFITGTWNLHEEPIAYYRSGDSPEYIEVFRKYGCKVKEHPHGYRSVHYLVKTSPNKNTYISEVQVRTIFEEGWSEIDHKIRYPYDRDNKLLSQFLVMFNRLSGNADEMGSYIQYLKKELDNKEKEYREAVEKKIEIIEDLKKRIKELELKPKVAQRWESELNKILNLPTLNINNFELKMPDFSNIQISDFSNIKITDFSSIIKIPDYLNTVLPNKIKQTGKETNDNREISKKKRNKKDK
jgi:putative GTP pyrophosphokinase